MNTQVTVRWVEDGLVRTGGLEAVRGSDGRAGVWIDVLRPEAEALGEIADALGLPPLAVEDCLHWPQRPKYDVYPEVTFLIWLLPRYTVGNGVESAELDVFLGREHLVTVHAEPLQAIDLVADSVGEYLPRGVEWTLHTILDLAVDDALPIAEQLSDELEELEDAMLENARPEHLERLHSARRAIVQLHKIVTPEREIVRGLARLEAFVAPEAYMYFQDIGDHLARVADSVDTYRDVASSAMDLYLSAVSNRMNAVMKQLTVIATIFMPLTLISGIYGMNFDHMPELAWRYGYFGILGSMVAITVGMLYVFKRRGWW